MMLISIEYCRLKSTYDAYLHTYDDNLAWTLRSAFSFLSLCDLLAFSASFIANWSLVGISGIYKNKVMRRKHVSIDLLLSDFPKKKKKRNYIKLYFCPSRHIMGSLYKQWQLLNPTPMQSVSLDIDTQFHSQYHIFIIFCKLFIPTHCISTKNMSLGECWIIQVVLWCFQEDTSHQRNLIIRMVSEGYVKQHFGLKTFKLTWFSLKMQFHLKAIGMFFNSCWTRTRRSAVNYWAIQLGN